MGTATRRPHRLVTFDRARRSAGRPDVPRCRRTSSIEPDGFLDWVAAGRSLVGPQADDGSAGVDRTRSARARASRMARAPPRCSVGLERSCGPPTHRRKTLVDVLASAGTSWPSRGRVRQAARQRRRTSASPPHAGRRSAYTGRCGATARSVSPLDAMRSRLFDDRRRPDAPGHDRRSMRDLIEGRVRGLPTARSAPPVTLELAAARTEGVHTWSACWTQLHERPICGCRLDG